MDDQTTPQSADSTWSGAFGQTLAAERDRAVEWLAAHRQQIDSVEQQLNSQLDELSAALSQESGALDNQRTELEQREAQHRQQLADATAQQQAAADKLRVQNDELQQQELELEAATAKLRQSQRALLAAQDEHDAAAEQLARRRARLEEQTAEVESQREQLATQLVETKAQRRRIAQEFKHQRERQQAEIQREREELDALRQSRQATSAAEASSELVAERDELRSRLAALETAHGPLQQQLRTREEQLGKLSAAYQSSQRAVQQCQTELQTVSKARDEASKAAGTFRNERDRLAAKLAAAENCLAEKNSVASQHDAELQRRFELAVEDVRELKRRNAELEEKIALTKSHSTLAVAGKEAVNEGLDWESQKRRLMAALEADDAPPKADRLTIAGTVRITDEIIARKDCEINDLKELLAQQSGNIGDVSVGVARFAAVLDNDEIVRQEREHLHSLQTEWREKMKQAEIELSLGRAKIARERVEIDEKLRNLEDARAQMARDLHEATASGRPAGKPQRGRWLSRLGLKDEDNG